MALWGSTLGLIIKNGATSANRNSGSTIGPTCLLAPPRMESAIQPDGTSDTCQGPDVLVVEHWHGFPSCRWAPAMCCDPEDLVLHVARCLLGQLLQLLHNLMGLLQFESKTSYPNIPQTSPERTKILQTILKTYRNVFVTPQSAQHVVNTEGRSDVLLSAERAPF